MHQDWNLQLRTEPELFDVIHLETLSNMWRFFSNLSFAHPRAGQLKHFGEILASFRVWNKDFGPKVNLDYGKVKEHLQGSFKSRRTQQERFHSTLEMFIVVECLV